MAMTTSSANLKVLFVTLLCAAVAASFLPGSSAVVSLFSRTCRKTLHESLCISLLWSDKRSINATTVQELATIALTVVGNSTRAAVLRAAKLSYVARSGTPTGNLLAQCRALYADCLRQTTEAAAMVAAARYDDAADVASVFHAFPEKCESLFYTHGIKSPLERTNKELQEKLGAASEIVGLLR